MRVRLIAAIIVFVVVGLISLYPAGSSVTANTSIVDLCLSTVSAPGGCVFVCPGGDGYTLADRGTPIDVTILDDQGDPIVGIAASDFWLIGCDNELALCGGSGSISADGPTDAGGHTTISGTIRAGGYANGLSVVVMGIVLGCPEPTCLPITVRSPDMDGDLDVDLVDFATFAADYTSPPKPYNSQADFNCDGLVSLIDVAMFGFHYLNSAHNC